MIKQNLKLRFAYIEYKLYWEDGFCAQELAEIFNLTRKTAQMTIDQYRAQHPNYMFYDGSKKRHLATGTFKPTYIKSKAISFLDYLRGQSLRAHFVEEIEWDEIEFFDFEKYLKQDLSISIVKTLITALRSQKTISIKYRSKMAHPIDTRIISPNYLVFVDNRYHLHAYCHITNFFTDFVLSRILHIEPADEEWVSPIDSEIHENITLRFKPNPELPQAIQKTLLRGYPGEEQGYWQIECNKNAAYYIQRKLNKIKLTPEEHGLEKPIQVWIEIDK